MTLLERIRNEPALVSGFLLAVFNLFAVDPEMSGPVIQLAGIAVPLILGLIVRQNVAGPKTAETLARGTLQQEATPAQRRKAREILGNGPVEGAVIPLELKRLAEQYAHLLPLPYAEIVAKGGLIALELALKTAQNAARRPATYDESKDAIRDLGSKL